MERVRRRIGDRRVLGLTKAFLQAGVLTEGGAHRDTITGTPQGVVRREVHVVSECIEEVRVG